jgi:hypothetical protein
VGYARKPFRISLVPVIAQRIVHAVAARFVSAFSAAVLGGLRDSRLCARQELIQKLYIAEVAEGQPRRNAEGTATVLDVKQKGDEPQRTRRTSLIEFPWCDFVSMVFG